MSKYFKKQKKTRTIFLNTDEASYVDSDRKTFNFYIPPINIEDESMLSVKNTILDYRSAGLSVKDVELPYISTTGISTGYNAPPNIIFTPQDGKGTGATAVGILQPVGLSTSATGSSTSIGVVSGGSGYAGLGSEYTSTFTDPASGGTGASILPTINTATSTLPTAITSTPTASGVGVVPSTNSDRFINFAYYGTGATGDYSFTTTEELLCDILVVAGGGGGGEKYGGGGGGGALYYAQNVFLPAGSFIARVGKGGVPVALADNAGSGAGAGNPSSLSFNGTNIIFMRGGAGGASGGVNTYGAFGGSGSGGAGPAGLGQNAGSGTNIPAGTYGNKGGNAFQIAGVANTICAGGGGGAFGAGGNAIIEPNGTQTRAGAGGAGLLINISGTNTTYCGGGGGGATTTGSFAGTAGVGGGGAGGITGVGGNGTNNLGGGGGGGGWNGTTAFAGGSGGNGYVVIKYTRNINRNGNITSAVLTAGSGYVNLPVINTPIPVSEPATFGTFPHATTSGNITGTPLVLNPTTNGFYNASTFRVGFVNNPVQLLGFCQTNGAGTITSITISNSDDNGFYRDFAPPVILAVNGVLLGSGFGVGLEYTFTYAGGRAVSCIVINGGSGYGNNLVDAPVLFSPPAIPTPPATILSKEIINGRLQSIRMGGTGLRYYKPSVVISAGLVAPVPALFNPIYLQPSELRGVRMLTNGRGYTKPPLVGISTATKIASLNGDMPLTAEMTQTHLVEPNNVYTIKAEGFNFNRTSYSNTDYKGRPTIAMCSPNEMMNDEEYSKLILPAQVINNLSLTITDRDGEGLDANKNLVIVIDIEELDQKDTKFEESKRQEY
jgi:hypothetical protein